MASKFSTTCNVTSALEAVSNAFGKLPSIISLILTPADDLTLLHEVDLPRNRVKAAFHHKTGLPVLNAEGGNKSVLLIDHRANSVLRRAWNALMK